MATLDGFVAFDNEVLVGVLTYAIRGDELEVVSIQADAEGQGVGQLLMQSTLEVAMESGCRRVWLTTTNDNIRAIRFYQQWGMDLAALHHDGVDRSRAVKPSIPVVGHHGIPLRHELEFELRLPL